MVLLRDEFHLDVFGCDADRDAVKVCRERDSALRVKRVRDNVLDYPSLTFDAVLAECSLSALDEDMRGEYFHEFYCVLKNGGKLAVSDVYDKSRRDYLCDYLKPALEDAGFRQTYFEDCSHVLPEYIAELIMNGVNPPRASDGGDTGYMLFIAEKVSI